MSTRTLLRSATVALSVAIATARAANAQAAGAVAPASRVDAVGAIGMTVSDLDRSADFFTRLLDFDRVSDVEVASPSYEHLSGVFGSRLRVATLRLGEEEIELTQYLAPEGRPMPADTRANDHWFQHIAIVTSDMDRAYERLRKHGVRHASSGPQRLPNWNPGAAGIQAFYFRDVDGHFLEIIAFPPGKGESRWHRPTDRLFLGIDHTAIVVEDTERSLAFYRDALGLEISGNSENFGSEQEHLNNVFGARLRITGLRAPRGPGIELLEYLAPGDGRPAPRDMKGNDLAHWQTRLFVENADRVAGRARSAGGSLVSPGAVDLPGKELGFSRGAALRDPDLHEMQIVESSTKKP